MDLLAWYAPRGRITRRVFWLHYVLPIAGLSVLALAVDVSFGYTSLDAVATQSQALPRVEYGPFVTGLAFLTFVPSIASQVTRLHDQGRSAWWLLLNVLPVLGQLALLGICGLVPGQPGPNRYGPPADGAGLPVGWGGPEQQPGWGAPPAPSGPWTPPAPSGPWTPGPQDRAPDHPPSDWR